MLAVLTLSLFARKSHDDCDLTCALNLPICKNMLLGSNVKKTVFPNYTYVFPEKAYRHFFFKTEMYIYRMYYFNAYRCISGYILQEYSE